ncbi:MAG: hypothetical protein ACKO3G_09930, partial [Planctomycetaceae bacterium]
PVASAEPIRLKKTDIEERVTSPVSIMPKGLLDKLSRDEVLDLVAYVAARGEESSALFSPDGCPHHAEAPVPAGAGAKAPVPAGAGAKPPVPAGAGPAKPPAGK